MQEVALVEAVQGLEIHRAVEALGGVQQPHGIVVQHLDLADLHQRGRQRAEVLAFGKRQRVVMLRAVPGKALHAPLDVDHRIELLVLLHAVAVELGGERRRAAGG